jgi:hydroxysqualene dehydroxylase
MPDVVVVGGGFAGLSAAAALVDAGADVLVLEARPGLGGRASSFRDPATGELVDNGQHVLLGCYHETRRFLARIGAADAVHVQDGLAVSLIDRAGAETCLSLPPLPSPLHLAGGVLAWRALTLRDRLSLLGIAPALLRARRDLRRPVDTWAGLKTRPYGVGERRVGGPGSGGSLDPPGAETVREWLVRHGQSERLCELLWEPLALAALNQSIDRAAAEYFIAVLARMFGPDASDAALVLPARPLTEMYAEPARHWIEARGGRVRTQAPATAIVEGDAVTGVRVREEIIPCRTVIAAVPWFALGDLFDDPPAALRDTLACAAATPPEPIVTVNLWTDPPSRSSRSLETLRRTSRPILDGPLIGLPGRTFQWVFDRRTIVGDGASHLSLVSSGAASVVELANDELVTLALRELREAMPRAREAVVRKASAVRERRATFSLAPGLPARPSTETAVRGLVLAGDWIDTGLPATIESAVISGHRAAQSALRTLEPSNPRTLEP